MSKDMEMLANLYQRTPRNLVIQPVKNPIDFIMNTMVQDGFIDPEEVQPFNESDNLARALHELRQMDALSPPDVNIVTPEEHKLVVEAGKKMLSDVINK